ncbi:nahoda [Carabus blaptoides fortunei]
MPKGQIRTSLLTGSKFNVTWHLAYPHRGGFKLQLLDHLERPVLDLTPRIRGSEFISNDVTAQSFEIQLPAAYVCKDCTMRLLRQANEWGPNYRFWSCADVTIKTREQGYRDTCSGHGRNLVGRCKCDRLYYGPHCQYRDECWEDSDCGNQGKCVDVKATTAPRSQCYCLTGWFGPGCNKRSPIKTMAIDFDLYNYRTLSDTFRLYWRILRERKEIEVIMIVNGTSYVGLGWRPRNLTSSCKNFPLIGNPVDTSENATNAEPNATSEPNSTVDPNAKAEPTSEPVSEPSSKPVSEHSLKPENLPTAEPNAEPEPTTLSPEVTGKSLYARSAAPTSITTSTYREEAIETSVSYKVSTKQGRRKREIDKEPVAEPTSQGSTSQTSAATPEPNSEPVSEPNSEPVTEPISEPVSEPVTTAKAEPTSQTDTHSKPEPSSEPEPSSKTHANLQLPPAIDGVQDKNQQPLNPYTPRHDFNAMDCTDIVIGSARGTASRIADYYTRDRSTPRMDSFWGGKNDLTAALGWEKDGITTIVFRKKLKATEMSDHSIEEDLMHVIWAQGQEPGKYVHVPPSGVEKDNASVKEFYKEDELKYHGHGMKRGQTHLNFFEQDNKVEPGTPGEADNTGEVDQTGSSPVGGTLRDLTSSVCTGQWKTPRSCSIENRTCEYSVQWQHMHRKDEIRFTITTSHTDTWTGIGFSKNEKMTQTDAILGWVEKKTGRPFLMDTWIKDYNQPLLDGSQDIYNTSGRIENGVTTLSFTRKRITNDEKDLSFTNSECLFMMFPVHGGNFHSVNKKIRKHSITPIISPERVCIRSCTGDDYDDSEAMTTPEPPAIGYNLQVRIVNLGENYQIPKKDTPEFKVLADMIRNNFKDVVNKVPGYKDLIIENLVDENKNVVAQMNLRYDKETVEKGRSLEDENGHFNEINKLLEDTIVTGQVGALRVDPEYFAFEAQSITSNVIPDESSENYGANNFFTLSTVKLYVVLGCIAALVLVAIVQASCTIYKTSHRQSPSHKDHLIPNSAWKDYSAANTNYAFEAFEPEEKLKNGHNGRSETLPHKNSSKVVRPTTRPPSVPPPGYAAPRTAGYMGDTRSLQRPRGPFPPVAVQERSTLSLPRTAYDRHRAPPDMQPDFYFMPSQRKYSGK